MSSLNDTKVEGTSIALLSYPFVKVDISVWYSSTGWPSEGSLVRGHIATVAWTGSLGRSKLDLALCESVSLKIVVMGQAERA